MNLSSLPVLSIITSKNCGHCINTRKDGFLQPNDTQPSITGTNGKNWAWNEKFFQFLLRGGADKGPQKFRVYEVHYTVLNPASGVEEFSEFTLTPEGKVQRIGYYNNNGILNTIKTIGYKQTKPSPTIVQGKNFVDVLNSVIPNKIGEYVFIYPSWIYVNGNDWNNAIKTGDTFYAYVASLKTIKVNGVFTVEKTQAAIGKQEDPVLNTSKILSGAIQLKYTEPPISPVISSPPIPSNIIHARTGCQIPEYQLLPQ